MAGSVQSIRSFSVNSELFVQNFKEEVHKEGSEVLTGTRVLNLTWHLLLSICNLNEAWGPQSFHEGCEGRRLQDGSGMGHFIGERHLV